MANPNLIQRRLEIRAIGALEVLRRLRRDRAEADVSMARKEETRTRMEREAASKARAAAVGDLHQWSRTITAQTDFERVRASSAISQPIFEFNELSSKLQRAEFGEFAAQRRESIAADQLANAMRIAKRAAISHEKILECHK